MARIRRQSRAAIRSPLAVLEAIYKMAIASEQGFQRQAALRIATPLVQVLLTECSNLLVPTFCRSFQLLARLLQTPRNISMGAW